MKVDLKQAGDVFGGAAGGFEVAPGQMGENITTRNIDLLALPAGARLTLGETAVIEVTATPHTGDTRHRPGLETRQWGAWPGIARRGIARAAGHNCNAIAPS